VDLCPVQFHVASKLEINGHGPLAAECPVVPDHRVPFDVAVGQLAEPRIGVFAGTGFFEVVPGDFQRCPLKQTGKRHAHSDEQMFHKENPFCLFMTILLKSYKLKKSAESSADLKSLKNSCFFNITGSWGWSNTSCCRRDIRPD
jgi:hypothetical protein